MASSRNLSDLFFYPNKSLTVVSACVSRQLLKKTCNYYFFWAEVIDKFLIKTDEKALAYSASPTFPGPSHSYAESSKCARAPAQDD